jgi:hypothetical protein
LKGTYYFRAIKESWDEDIIKAISAMGHEIGYHYEDVDFAYKLLKKKNISPSQPPTPKGESLPSGNQSLPAGQAGASEAKELINTAIQLFEKNLTKIRKFAPVNTICMHGSPLSKYDNKLLWKYYNYKDFGIIGEPYFDIDFSKVLYLTDTGRRWNGDRVSIRDKINNNEGSPLGDKGASVGNKFNFKRTSEIILAVEKEELPNQIMFTFHPQRWTNSPVLWTKELVWQNVKNVMKYFLNKIRKL